MLAPILGRGERVLRKASHFPNNALAFFHGSSLQFNLLQMEILKIKGSHMLDTNVQTSHWIPTLKPYYPGLTFFVVWLKTSSALVFSHGKESAGHVANANHLMINVV